jgi:hypothetical protein
MKQKQILIWVIILVVVAFLVWPNGGGGGEYTALADCLTDSGAKMYGAFWCAHCKDQKAAFGSAWSKVNYIECSTADGQGQTDVCVQAGVKGYPTWEFGDGSRASGKLSFADLAARSGCSLA